MIFLIDRRFLDIAITIKKFTSNPDNGDHEDGDQFILSADWTSYPDAKKDCIARYNRHKRGYWNFIKPSEVFSCEVINLETGEILKYQEDSNDNLGWQVVGYVGAATFPYVVDEAVSSHSAVQGRVGLTYILPNTDNSVYKVTGSGSNGYTSITSLSPGNKVAVVKDGRIYTIVNSDNTDKFDSNYSYIPAHILVVSSNTQNVYVSAYSTGGYDLVPVNQQRTSAGEATGSLCIERHVFTAAEITAREFYLSSPALESSQYTVVCYMGGSVHIVGEAFICYYNDSTHLLQISWDDDYGYWYDNSPREGEVAIFQYYKI